MTEIINEPRTVADLFREAGATVETRVRITTRGGNTYEGYLDPAHLSQPWVTFTWVSEDHPLKPIEADGQDRPVQIKPEAIDEVVFL